MFYVDRRSIVFAIPNNGGNSERLRYTKIKIVTFTCTFRLEWSGFKEMYSNKYIFCEYHDKKIHPNSITESLKRFLTSCYINIGATLGQH